MSDFWDFVTQASNWSGQRGITHRAFEHLRISILATMLAVLIALPPAVWLGHIRRYQSAVTLVNLGRALPSYGIMLLAVPISIRWGYGIGFWPAFVALLFLAIPPVFTNAYTGVRQVDTGTVEAAVGMGMTPREVLLKVEIPNALPLILTGIRITAVQVVATATLAALAGFQNLGSFLNEGIAGGDDAKLYTGAIAVAVIAVGTDLVFTVIERASTPWLRRRRIGRVEVASVEIQDRRVTA